jgi:hypothetical protein
MQMIKKKSVLIGVVISTALIMIAIWLYPGGSRFNQYSVGFEWSRSFMSNLFGAKALNGADNPSRFWAYAGMIILPITYAIFFINMAKKIPDKNAAFILKYGGISNIFFYVFNGDILARYHAHHINQCVLDVFNYYLCFYSKDETLFV